MLEHVAGTILFRFLQGEASGTWDVESPPELHGGISTQRAVAVMADMASRTMLLSPSPTQAGLEVDGGGAYTITLSASLSSSLSESKSQEATSVQTLEPDLLEDLARIFSISRRLAAITSLKFLIIGLVMISEMACCWSKEGVVYLRRDFIDLWPL